VPLTTTEGMIARDPDGALKLVLDFCDRRIAEDGLEVIILGDVGLVGMADRINTSTSISCD
jgi:Asp/Glu/hydantoin racemase